VVVLGVVLVLVLGVMLGVVLGVVLGSVLGVGLFEVELVDCMSLLAFLMMLGMQLMECMLLIPWVRSVLGILGLDLVVSAGL